MPSSRETTVLCNHVSGRSLSEAEIKMKGNKTDRQTQTWCCHNTYLNLNPGLSGGRESSELLLPRCLSSFLFCARFTVSFPLIRRRRFRISYLLCDAVSAGFLK